MPSLYKTIGSVHAANPQFCYNNPLNVMPNCFDDKGECSKVSRSDITADSACVKR